MVSLFFARFLTPFQFCNNLFYLFHFRLFGCMCSGCNQIISPTELVMKALQYVYHIDCFKCHECGDKLEKGDEFLLKDDKLYCSSDFNVAEQRSDSKNSFWQVRIFLKTLWENTCTGVSLKKRLRHKCFLVNFAKSLRTPILKNICEQLLLKQYKNLQTNQALNYCLLISVWFLE